MVGTRTIKGPNKSGHYAILNLPELKKELVISWAADGGKSNLNPKLGAKFAFDKCLKNIRNLHATPLGLVNCLNFGHPKDSMGALAETLDGLKERCKSNKIPIVGGNVSLYNAHKNHSIKPTPVLVLVGLKNKSYVQNKVNNDA